MTDKIYYPADQANEKLAIANERLQELTRALNAAVLNCIYRINGQCWPECKALLECTWSQCLPPVGGVK